jgi:hypothetical protein
MKYPASSQKYGNRKTGRWSSQMAQKINANTDNGPSGPRGFWGGITK